MKPQPKCCRTCLFSRWWLTPTGKIKNVRTQAGRCTAPLPDFKALLPSCIDPPVVGRRGVWPQEGSDCPLYEANEGKPISEAVR